MTNQEDKQGISAPWEPDALPLEKATVVGKMIFGLIALIIGLVILFAAIDAVAPNKVTNEDFLAPLPTHISMP